MIDYAIVSTNENLMYRNFWPVVKYAWNRYIGVKPILIDICDYNEIKYFEDCIIVSLKKVKGIDTGFQAQISRIYVPSLFPNKRIILSDIDMIPLNRNYFQNVGIDQHDLIIFSSDWEEVNNIPMCYIAGYGHLLDLVFETNCSFTTFVKLLHKRGHGWGGDQEYISDKILNYNFIKNKKVNFKKLNRGWNKDGVADKRIDRVCLSDIENYTDIENWIDFHCPRPYDDHSQFIKDILKLKDKSMQNYES